MYYADVKIAHKAKRFRNFIELFREITKEQFLQI